MAAGRIKSMKNSGDTVRNPTSDFPDFNAVPQPTVPPLFRKLSKPSCERYGNEERGYRKAVGLQRSRLACVAT
jgi:hypothetical protein